MDKIIHAAEKEKVDNLSTNKNRIKHQEMVMVMAQVPRGIGSLGEQIFFARFISSCFIIFNFKTRGVSSKDNASLDF
jgi:hypothetical protein